MATKINTKFVTIAIVCVALMGLMSGAVVFLNHYRGPERARALGDEAFAAGEFNAAESHYGRALGKEPTNHEYLELYRKAVMSLVPSTREQAVEYYNKYVGSLAHEANHFPDNPDAHLNLLSHQFRFARLIGSTDVWQNLIEPAEKMLDDLPEDEPKRIEGLFYRGTARMQLGSSSSLDSVLAGEQDLIEYLESRSDNDTAWAFLIVGQLRIANDYTQKGNRRQAAEQYVKVDQTMKQALQRLPEGPETLRSQSQYLMSLIRNRPEQGVTIDDLLQVTRKIEQLVESKEVHPMTLVDMAAVIRMTDLKEGKEKSRNILRNFLDENPDSLYHKMKLAEWCREDGLHDEAREMATAVITTDWLPVSIMSRFQREIRREMARTLFLVEYDRWERESDPAQKNEQLTVVKAERDRLLDMVGSPESRSVLRADGMIAYAERDFLLCAEKLVKLVQQTSTTEPEIIMYLSRSLEELGDTGAAMRYLKRSVENHPEDPRIGVLLARLYAGNQNFDDATATLDKILARFPEYPPALDLQKAIRKETEGGLMQPGGEAIEIARGLFNEGRWFEAIDVLEPAYKEHPRNLELLKFLTIALVKTDQIDRARKFVYDAIAMFPNNAKLKRVLGSLDEDNAVEVVVNFVNDMYSDETERTVAMVINLYDAADRHLDMANQFEETQAPDRVEQEMAWHRDALAKAQEAERLAMQVAPDNKQLIRFQFDRAIQTRDQDRAAEILERAKAANADGVNGLLFQGQYDLIRAASLIGPERQKSFERAVAALQSVTERRNFSGTAWRELARAHFGLGQIGRSLNAYAKSHENDPRDRSTIIEYCRLLRQTGDFTRALRILRASVRMDPNNSLMREEWLQTEAEHGDLFVAMKQRRFTFANNPTNVINSQNLAQLLTMRRPDFLQIVGTDGNQKYTLDRWVMIREGDRRQELADLQQSWFDEAERVLDSMESYLPEEAELHITALRAKLSLHRGYVKEGEAALQRYVESQSLGTDRYRGMLALAAYYNEAELPDQAIYMYRQAIELQGDDWTASNLLASALSTEGKIDEAYEIYESIPRDIRPHATRTVMIQCLISLGELEQAEAHLKDLEREFGSDISSTLLAASISASKTKEHYRIGDEQAGDDALNDTLDILQEAKELNPLSAMPHLREAELRLNRYLRLGDSSDLDRALVPLDEAMRIRTDNAQVVLMRARIHVANDDSHIAKSELNEFLRAKPVGPDADMARQRLVDIYLEEGENAGAINVIRDAINRDSNNPVWWVALGRLLTHRGNHQEAFNAYVTAYEQSKAGGVLELAVNAAMAQGDFDKAGALLERHTEAMDGQPVLRALYTLCLSELRAPPTMVREQLVKTYQELRHMIDTQGVNPAAIGSILEIIPRIYDPKTMTDIVAVVRDELAGGSLDAFEAAWLARYMTQTGQGGLDRAIDLQRQAIELCPTEERLDAERSQLHVDLGNYLFLAGQAAAARESYVKAISIYERNPEAHNNIAFVLAEALNEPAAALAHAQKANEIVDSNANYMDTLGRVLYLNGRYSDAEVVLRQSIEVVELASNCLHLAQVLLELGETQRARTYCNRAYELNPDDETREQIENLLDDIS